MPLTYGFLDIETTDFNAQFGNMLTWCIKDQDGDIHEDCITREESIDHRKLDKRIAKSLIKKMKDYDVIVTFYGTRFDIPYIRTRGVMNGLKFPLSYGDNIHLDLYYTVRRNFKLRGNSLKNACAAILGDTNKTEVTHDEWRAARLGDKKALKYVLEHNRMDVIDTERLYNAIIPFRKRLDGSI
jgi:uncharacterized protein YprB with RNaseH-like and TPR domain